MRAQTTFITWLYWPRMGVKGNCPPGWPAPQAQTTLLEGFKATHRIISCPPRGEASGGKAWDRHATVTPLALGAARERFG